MTIQFHGRVAIVTGAGSGLGRSHAKALAARGAKVVVNDLGRNGAPSDNALSVVEEIRAGGGTAIADPRRRRRFRSGLRHGGACGKGHGAASTFSSTTLASCATRPSRKWRWRISNSCSACISSARPIARRRCGPGMRERDYGRIVLTSSASGIYGNFGQANYGAAKAAMIGLMNVLHLEGLKHDIRVNVLAPTALTAMTEGLLPPVAAELMSPESVTPGVLFLASEDAPSRVILGAGAGVFAVTHIGETPGVYLDESRAHARDDRRALRRDFRSEDGRAAQGRLRTDHEVRRGGGEGEGRQSPDTCGEGQSES